MSERKRSHGQSPGGRSRNDSVERVPVMRTEDIRELPDFTVLVLFRNLGPIIGRVRPVWTRRDVKAAGEPPAAKRTPTTPLAPIYWLADYRRQRRNRKAS